MGIDPNTERLQIARENYSGSNLTYIQAGAENIPGGDYDMVFANHVMHWCDDIESVFKSVAKSLKQGGKFGFVTSADFDHRETFFSPAEMFTQEGYQAMVNQVHSYPSDTYTSFAAANGLKVTHISKHMRDWKFDGVAKLVEFYMTHYQTCGSHFNVEAMKKHHGNGKISIVVPIITVVVQKN